VPPHYPQPHSPLNKLTAPSTISTRFVAAAARWWMVRKLPAVRLAVWLRRKKPHWRARTREQIAAPYADGDEACPAGAVLVVPGGGDGDGVRPCQRRQVLCQLTNL
jgi:hypothetical protein